MNLDNSLLTNRSTGGLSGTGEWDFNQLIYGPRRDKTFLPGF